MGAERFDQYQKGTDVKVAFREARDDAAYEYGHGGYTGSLAEKLGYEMRNNGKPLTMKEAEAFANKDLDENEHDKWGNAWCVPIKRDDSDEIFAYLFYGWASS